MADILEVKQSMVGAQRSDWFCMVVVGRFQEIHMLREGYY